MRSLLPCVEHAEGGCQGACGSPPLVPPRRVGAERIRGGRAAAKGTGESWRRGGVKYNRAIP